MTRFPARATLRRVMTAAVLLFAYAGCSSESELMKPKFSEIAQPYLCCIRI
jgi:hypothetical protein